MWKIDIFKGVLWYAYEGEWMNWHEIAAEDVNEIIASNTGNEKVASLEEFASELVEDTKVLSWSMCSRSITTGSAERRSYWKCYCVLVAGQRE